MTENGVILLSHGEVALWDDDGRAVHLKAVTKLGDPVELSAEEAKELAKMLVEMANRVE
jgi:hypothetical protein